MMGLKLYGVLRSRASRVAWLCNELGMSYEHVPVMQAYRLADLAAPDAPFNTASPEYRKVNANGLIPTIDDDGFVMHESLAINLYLAKKHGGALAPRDAREEALMTMWALWAATEVEPRSVVIVMNMGKNQDIVDAAAAALPGPFGVLEAALERGGGHIVGGRFTVADLNTAEVLRYAQTVPALFDRFPAVKAWIAACQSRPAFKSMMAAREKEPA
ncbi:MAG: glutathione S-transferase family protein [Reyranellaceae bacterium]